MSSAFLYYRDVGSNPTLDKILLLMHQRVPLSSYVSRDHDIAKMARQSPVLKVRAGDAPQVQQVTGHVSLHVALRS